ncbi:MAG: hypothetical protein PXX83_07035 [Candidatus Nitrosotalea sp.]|nr:hypothetical protein [Candidatus Nitrosotalea sp.]
MKTKLSNLNIVMMGLLTMFVFTTIQFGNAFAEVKTDSNYQLKLKGHTDSEDIKDYELNLHLSTKYLDEKTVLIDVLDGIFTFSGTLYAESGEWEGVYIPEKETIMVSGNAEDGGSSTLHIELAGLLVNNTQHGAYFKILGSITNGSSSLHFEGVTEVKNTHFLTTSEIIQMPHVLTMQHPQLVKVGIIKKYPPITLLVKEFDRVHIQYTYSDTAKVYYKHANPFYNFNLHGGEVKDANITATIFNDHNKTIISFTGKTNQFGYYSDGFRIPDNADIGKYTAFVVAEKNGRTDSKVLNFYVLPPVENSGEYYESSSIDNDNAQGKGNHDNAQGKGNHGRGH